MKLKDAKRLNSEEIMKLKIGDKVWFCSLMVIPYSWDGDLEQGIIKDIKKVKGERSVRPVIAADLLEPEGDIVCFIITPSSGELTKSMTDGGMNWGWQVPPSNIFKGK